jgi:hypothetical protein
LPVCLGRLGDNGERGPAEAVDSEKARTQRHALLLAERGRILVPEDKRTGNRPFTGFRRGILNMAASSEFRTAHLGIIPSRPAERI